MRESSPISGSDQGQFALKSWLTLSATLEAEGAAPRHSPTRCSALNSMACSDEPCRLVADKYGWCHGVAARVTFDRAVDSGTGGSGETLWAHPMADRRPYPGSSSRLLLPKPTSWARKDIKGAFDYFTSDTWCREWGPNPDVRDSKLVNDCVLTVIAVHHDRL